MTLHKYFFSAMLNLVFVKRFFGEILFFNAFFEIKNNNNLCENKLWIASKIS